MIKTYCSFYLVTGSSLSSMEAVYIAGTIFLLYLVVDIFLVTVVVACIRKLRQVHQLST